MRGNITMCLLYFRETCMYHVCAGYAVCRVYAPCVVYVRLVWCMCICMWQSHPLSPDTRPKLSHTTTNKRHTGRESGEIPGFRHPPPPPPPLDLLRGRPIRLCVHLFKSVFCCFQRTTVLSTSASHTTSFSMAYLHFQRTHGSICRGLGACMCVRRV